MRKAALVSLGCAKNLIDSEMLLSSLEGAFEPTVDPSKADLIIINTCGFIEAAKIESIGEITRYAEYKNAKLVVTGCLTERYLEELQKEMPEVDLFVPIREYPNFHRLIASLFPGEIGDLNPVSPLRRTASGNGIEDYLRISEGCDHFCSFCAIPYIRGRYVSRPMDEILLEANNLYEKGVKEISLISQDPAAYGKDFEGKKPDFSDLLLALDEIPFHSIRLLYLYPRELDDRFIKTVKESKRILPYFDIPVQSGSDKVLRLMNRTDTVETTLNLINKIREAMPKAVFRTTLIAGFPGETEDDVEATLSFLDEARFDHVGVFSYSREEGTRGYKMPDQVPQKEKDRRRLMYLEKAKGISLKQNLSRVGDVVDALVVGKGRSEGEYLLRSYWNAPDDIDGAFTATSAVPLELGSVVKAKVTAGFYFDLRGEVLP